MTSVKKNFGYQMIYEILFLLLPFITSPYIARVIGPEGTGIYSYSYSIATYFVLFSMLGIKLYGNRVIAQNRDSEDELNSSFSNLLAIHIIISLICLSVYLVYILTLKEYRLYAVIQTATVLGALFNISWFYFGMERFQLTVTCSVIIRIASVLCVFIFVKEETDLWKYCAILAFESLLNQLILWIPLNRYVRLTKPEIIIMAQYIKPMVILFIPTIAVSIYRYMDKIMLGTISGRAQLGLYENADKVISIPMSVITVFGMVMLPRMSNIYHSANTEQASEYTKYSMRYVMLLAFAISFGIAGVGNVFAPVFWGKAFLQSGRIIMVLSITIPFMAFANVIRTQCLIPKERDREFVVSVIAGAIINLAVNFVLIPFWGVTGAAIGTVAAEVTVCLIQTFAVKNEMDILNYMINSIPFMIFGSIMYFAARFISVVNGPGLFTLILQIVAGSLIYLSCSAFYLLMIRDQVFIKTISDVNTVIRKGRQKGLM